MAGRARKAWGDYSPDYRARLARHGVTEQNYRDISRSSARGHAKTPEHPSEARKHPERYREYNRKHAPKQGPGLTLTQQIVAKKQRLWGTVHKFDPAKARKFARVNPVTGERPDPEYVAEFLGMSDDDFESAIDWGDPEWGFIFYH